MTVSVSLVAPSVEVIFDDDVPQILSAVDADTVLGRIPGTTGLAILQATNPDSVISIIGAATPTQSASLSQQAVAAHVMAADPHRVYLREDELSTLAEMPGARAAIAAHAMAVDPHRAYVKTSDLSSLAEVPGAGRAAVAAHAMAADPHPIYVLPADLPSLIDPVSSARQVVSSHALAVNPHPQYPTTDQMMIADSDTANLVMAHATGRSAHPDRPTFDQSILQSQFFGA